MSFNLKTFTLLKNVCIFHNIQVLCIMTVLMSLACFFQWDPKITTLPGLYFISVGVLMPLSALFGTDLCSIYGLRAVNLVVSSVNFYLIYNITKILHPGVVSNLSNIYFV